MPASSPSHSRLNADADDFVHCPQCGTYMVPLKDYDPSRTSASPSDTEWWEFVVWGWWSFVINYVTDLFTAKGRHDKLETERGRVLPEFPNSLTCPGCLHTILRK